MRFWWFPEFCAVLASFCAVLAPISAVSFLHFFSKREKWEKCSKALFPAVWLLNHVFSKTAEKMQQDDDTGIVIPYCPTLNPYCYPYCYPIWNPSPTVFATAAFSIHGQDCVALGFHRDDLSVARRVTPWMRGTPVKNGGNIGGEWEKPWNDGTYRGRWWRIIENLYWPFYPREIVAFITLIPVLCLACGRLRATYVFTAWRMPNFGGQHCYYKEKNRWWIPVFAIVSVEKEIHKSFATCSQQFVSQQRPAHGSRIHEADDP